MPSYEKNKKSGLWSVRFREKSIEDGTQRNMRLSGFKTKKDAQYGYEDHVNEYKRLADEATKNAQIKKQPADMLFGELIAKYFDFEKPRVKDGSYYDLTKKISSKILPFFEKLPIKEIAPANILDWQKTLSNYSYTYQKDIHTHLVSIYNFAEKYYDIPNIMRKVDRPRNLEGKKEMEIWTPEELYKVLDKVENPTYRLFYLFLYISGCRRGEAAALTWKDFDLTKGTVSIRKSLAYKVGEGGKPYRVTTPKNQSSNRTLPLPDFFVSELKSLKNASADSFVFSIDGGSSPLPPTSIERNLTLAAKNAGVKRIRIHDLRHSCASFLIHQGINVVTISHHLGHASTKMTLDTYSHLFPTDSEIIRTNLESLSPHNHRT